MLNNEWTLSEKKVNWNQGDVIPSSDIWYKERHIKNFIKYLKFLLDYASSEDWSIDKTFEEIDKLAGEKLR